MNELTHPPPQSGLDMPITVTFFRDEWAKAKQEVSTTLRDLMPALRDTRGHNKASLPWLKLAAFGDRYSDKGSLRNNANVVAIHGVEADYDAATITVERAARIVGQAGLAAVIYTSPSHTPETPKWRILCPTSCAMPPSDRAGLLARLNGLFVGALAAESFTLSQSYYYGAVGAGEHHEVIALDGRPIDLASELAAGAVGRPSPPRLEASPPTQPRPLAITDGTAWGLGALRRACEAIRNAPDGGKHSTLNREAYSIGGLVTGGDLIDGVARAALADALAAIRHRCDDYKAAERTLADAFKTGMDKPRQPPPAMPPAPPQRMPFGIGEATMASGHTYDPETGEILGVPEGGTPVPAHPAHPRLLSIAEIEAMPPPEWIIDGLLPAQGLIIPYGPPKVGKTFVVLSMGLHIAAGKDWCGRAVRQGVVVYIAGEGLGGLALRIKAMRLEYDIPADVPFFVRPKAVNFRDPQAVAELIAVARDTAAGHPIALVVVDTLARAMPGVDENSAQEVGLVIAACDAVKEQLQCSVAPIHHTGKDQERGMRGSNAIHGAVDTTLRIKAAGDRRIQMINEDQKDGEPAPPMTFAMKEVSTGFRSSLVPVLEDAAPLGRPPGEQPDADELLTRVALAMGGVREAPLGRLAEMIFGLRNGRNAKMLADALPASRAHAAVLRLGDRTVYLWRRIAGEHRTAPIYVMQEAEDAE
jgi:hypothetical protein